MQSTLGERLKILRHNNNMTQEEVSKYLNVQRQSYSHYENDKRMQIGRASCRERVLWHV